MIRFRFGTAKPASSVTTLNVMAATIWKATIAARLRSLAVARTPADWVADLVAHGAQAIILGFQVVEKLGGSHPLPDDFTVRVDSTTPAYGIVKSFQGRLIGKTMVLFARGFTREGDDPIIHFHASPDDADASKATVPAS